MAEVSAPEDREVSVDVDRLMDRITELSRLTRESIEEDVVASPQHRRSIASPQADDRTGSPSHSFGENRRAVAKHSPSVNPSVTSSRRSSKTSKASAGYAESALVIARLENVIQQVRGRGQERRSSVRKGNVGESVSLGSQSEVSGDEFPQDEFSVDDVLEDLRHRIAKLETESRMLCKLFMESESRIKTDVLAKLDKVIETKLYKKCHALESQSYALENKCHVLEHLCDNLESQAQQRLGALQALFASITREAKSGSQKKLTAGEVPINDNLSSPTSPKSNVSMDKLPQLADLKSQVLADIEGKMVVLRQEISGVEENMKMYVCEHLQAETQARIDGHQELMEEIEKETKARLCDSLDVWRTLSASHSDPPSRVSVQRLKIAQGPIMVPIR